MLLKKAFYQTIAFIKYQKEVYYYKNETKKILLKKRKTKPLKKKSKVEITKKFSKYGFNNISTKEHRYFNSFYDHLDDRIIRNFIPDHLFHSKIEPALNQSIMFPALEDKNLLDKLLPSSYLPETIVKKSNGFYYISNSQASFENAIMRCAQYDEFVIKPSIGTYGGKGVRKIVLSEQDEKSFQLEKLFSEYHSDFIVQKIVKQNSELAKLNASSINTIRVVSYMRTNEVITLSSVMRIGKSGEFTDNQSSGGIACGVDDNGKLRKIGIDQYASLYHTTENGTLLEGFQIPNYPKVLSVIRNLHTYIPYFKLISWDVTLDEKSDVKIIEFNAIGQGIKFHQELNGPLFGKFTDEILEITQKYSAIEQLMKYGK